MAFETNVMLTTVDNPYDPFTQFDEWYEFDETAGYHSSGLLARITKTSEELSEADQELAEAMAIDEIIRENVSGVHRKAYPKSENVSVTAG